MRTKLIVAVALTGAVAVVATPVQATTIGECQALIADLSADTAAATSLGESGPGLFGKAEAAAAKLNENKVADARQKLTDYDSALDALFSAATPKVSETDYATLNTDVESAIDCIDEISATS